MRSNADLYLTSTEPGSYYAAEDLKSAQFVEEEPLSTNAWVRLQRFRWPGGSEAIVDSRGLLHLRSSDLSVPEMTLTLILGRPLAAWAADGTVCGSSYFTGPEPASGIPVEEFYEQYLRRFISGLID
ncbi:hypothetical protein [Hymenobacter cellulosilyticus]|uniref:MoxR-vWA-beta-propeller ternary system domain-containing protein n=1 Tax=Hymenobacter cellulosilyticus TaxID=2932248 RepID=A0A8T9Q4P4_9BACT|nr:hypothetical protein [Hymenobacter cellulosilyticus]UOQ70449.1 hypothetical protein MUN79_17120 [Hymenobacter cellulosilyticus]